MLLPERTTSSKESKWLLGLAETGSFVWAVEPRKFAVILNKLLSIDSLLELKSPSFSDCFKDSSEFNL